MSELNKRYIVGPEVKLKDLFPDYHGQDERTMPDGKILIEVNLSDLKLASMQGDEDLTVMTHEEALEYVGKFQPAQDSTERVPMSGKSSKSKKIKATDHGPRTKD